MVRLGFGFKLVSGLRMRLATAVTVAIPVSAGHAGELSLRPVLFPCIRDGYRSLSGIMLIGFHSVITPSFCGITLRFIDLTFIRASVIPAAVGADRWAVPSFPTCFGCYGYDLA